MVYPPEAGGVAGGLAESSERRSRSADGRVYSCGLHLRGADLHASVHCDVFRTGVVEYLSEDFWVCRELLRLGFAIHLDPAIATRHSGMLEA